MYNIVSARRPKKKTVTIFQDFQIIENLQVF